MEIKGVLCISRRQGLDQMFNYRDTTARARWVKVGKIVCKTNQGIHAAFMYCSKNTCLVARSLYHCSYSRCQA
jgi:hypothetical protein